MRGDIAAGLGEKTTSGIRPTEDRQATVRGESKDRLHPKQPFAI